MYNMKGNKYSHSVMPFIKYSKDKQKFSKIINSQNRFRCVERGAVEIMNAATNSNMKIDEGEERVNVCVAIQGMMEDSRIEGRAEGRMEGSMLTCKEMGHSQKEAKKYIMVKYKKSVHEADEMIRLYWK